MNALHLAKEIKVRLTFREAAALVGIHDLPRDDVKFRSPLRPDRNPSCTIHKEVMTDWSRRENFDAISFYAAAKGVGNAEAIRQLADRLGIRNTAPRQTPKAAPKESQHGHASFQCFEPSDADFAVILQTRKLPHEAESGLFLAWSLGILEFGSVHGFRSWIVTDESRRIAEARRLDGQPFPALGSLGTRKSHTLKGSKKDWAVGLAPGTCRNLSDLTIVLCEGAPDLLCAYALLAATPPDVKDVQPVAMLGASNRIGAEALEVMRGRKVVILAHGDRAGREAAERWAKQLTASQCEVIVRELPDGKDLNDLMTEQGMNGLEGILL